MDLGEGMSISAVDLAGRFFAHVVCISVFVNASHGGGGFGN